ncbi:MAG: hypothetical protein HUU55_19405 [Myxococcales bacterium]|nr:hypothetical protein [Myxococcales bacterium]
MRYLSWIVILSTLTVANAAFAEVITLTDPKGDDKGPGTYEYPTDGVYRPGSFDLTKVTFESSGDDTIIEVEIAAKIEDPWDSSAWGGNGFSLQFVQIYLDTNKATGSGHAETLPGLNARFSSESAWEKVVLISPQGKNRLQSEVNAKAKALKDDVVIPRKTSVKGRTLRAVVSNADLGSAVAKGWGYQVVMQSNEGFPDKSDLLTRKVNEYAGPHRFGGGSDWECDPHIIDMVAGGASGNPDETKAQADALKYTCDKGGDVGKSTLATLPMVYR